MNRFGPRFVLQPRRYSSLLLHLLAVLASTALLSKSAISQEVVYYYAPAPTLVIAWSPGTKIASVARFSADRLAWSGSTPSNVNEAFVPPTGQPEFFKKVLENSWDSPTLKHFDPSALLLIRTDQKPVLSILSEESVYTFGLEATDEADPSASLKTIIGAKELKALTGVDGPNSWAKWKAQAATLHDALVVSFKNGRETEWVVELPVPAAEWEQIMKHHFGLKDAVEKPVVQQSQKFEERQGSTSAASDEWIWVWIGKTLTFLVLVGAGWYVWKWQRRSKAATLGHNTLPSADRSTDPAGATATRLLAKSVWDEVWSSVQGEMEARGNSAESKYLLQTYQFANSMFERHWLRIAGSQPEARQFAETALEPILQQIGAADVGEAKQLIANSKRLDQIRAALRPSDTSTEVFLESLKGTFQEAATVPTLKQQTQNNAEKVASYDRLHKDFKQRESDLQKSQGDNKALQDKLDKLENVKILLDQIGELRSLYDDSWQAIRGLHDRDEKNPEVVSAMAVLLQRGLAGLAIAIAKADAAGQQLHGGNLFRLSKSAADRDLQYFKNLASKFEIYDGDNGESSGGHADAYFIERLKKTLRDYYGLKFKYQLVASLPQSHRVTGGQR